jgi:hypothetical protein
MSYGLIELGRGGVIVEEHISKGLRKSLKGESTMKGNIRNLAVFVIVAAIAMCIAVAMASADEHHWKKTIGRVYAANQVLSSIFSIGGFNPNLTPMCFTPPTGPPVCISSVMLTQREGVFTFKKNGTGSATWLSGSSITVSPPSAATATGSFHFTYTVDEDGMITITPVAGTYFVTYTSGPNAGATIQAEGVVLTGPISPDGKNINLVGTNMTTLIIPGLPQVVNNNFGQSTTFLVLQDE